VRRCVSLHTLESHVKYVYRKLEVHSTHAAVWRAVELRRFGEADETESIPQWQMSSV